MKKQFAIAVAVISIFTSCRKVDSNIDESQNDHNQITSGHRDSGGASGGVDFKCESCVVSYPDSSNLPRSLQVFNENEILVATEPGQNTCGIQPDEIKVWYSDEHAITLGVRQVVIKTKTGTTTTDYAVTPTPSKTSVALDPKIGTTILTGDQSGNDVAIDGGRPLWPALFITDISENLKNRSGDWQQGGTPYAPTRIAGTWKAAVKIVDKTRTPNVITIQPDRDPSYTNFWNLGGGDTPPLGTPPNEKYGAMVAWKVSSLGLLPGHIYRLQFMIHDGDQNKAGGDVGQSCTTIIMPDPTE